jgi:hypothetical protein
VRGRRVTIAAFFRIASYVVGVGGVIWALSSPPAESGDPAAVRLALLIVAVLGASGALHLAARLLEGD